MESIDNFDESATLSNIKELIKRLDRILVKEITIDVVKCGIPGMMLHYMSSCSHRMKELCDDTIDVFLKANIISAALLVRGALETAAAYHCVSRKMMCAIEDHDITKLSETLKRLSQGTSPKQKFFKNPVEAIRIPDFFEGEDDEIGAKLEDQFILYYDYLSEYSHPNGLGVVGHYSFINSEGSNMYLGKSQHLSKNETYNLTRKICLLSLEKSLDLFLVCDDVASKSYLKLVEVCKLAALKNNSEK